MGRETMIEKCMQIYKKYKEIINYLIVGGLTTLVSLSVYYGCVFTVLNPQNPIQLQMANVISWIMAVAFAYAANRKYVFNSTNPNKKKELFTFVSSRVSTLLLDMAIMFFLVTLLQWNDKTAKLLVQVIVTIVNYVLSKCVVFRKKTA